MCMPKAPAPVAAPPMSPPPAPMPAPLAPDQAPEDNPRLNVFQRRRLRIDAAERAAVGGSGLNIPK